MTVEIRTPEPVAAPTKSVPEVLRDAARIIEERGWCQNAVQDLNGAVCAWGGIRLAIYGDSDSDGSTAFIELDEASTRALAEYLEPGTGIFIGTVASWNDEPGRSVPEVVAALRGAAEKAAA